jgi:hypothetical protein
MAKDLVLVHPPVPVKVGVERLRVAELFIAAFLATSTFHMIDGKEFVLRDSAAWALAPAAVFDQDTLANSACALSGSLSSCLFAVAFVRGVFLCIMRALTVTFVI